jgi:hypothetical protein
MKNKLTSKLRVRLGLGKSKFLLGGALMVAAIVAISIFAMKSGLVVEAASVPDPGGGGGGGGGQSWQGVNDILSAQEGATASFNSSAILGNDGVAGISVGAVASALGIQIPVSASGTTIVTSLGGVLSIYPNGSFTYIAPVLHGDTAPNEDSFWYFAVDINGITSDPITVTITVTDTLPVANDDTYEAYHDRRTVGYVMDNDDQSADGEAQVAAIRAADGYPVVTITGPYASPSDANATGVTAHGGLIWINPDGSFEYAPSGSYFGLDTFQYRLIDADGSLGNWATVMFDVPVPSMTEPSKPVASLVPGVPNTGHLRSLQ